VNALIATVIVIGSRERVDEAAQALDVLSDRAAVRRVLISEGTKTETKADDKDTTIRLDGLSPEYVDNAVAWLRLSSLPAVVWWRGGSPSALERIAHLADRLVLDTDPPDTLWPRAQTLFEETALTDLHWGGLTRWRSAMAHLFDLPQVRNAAQEYTTLEIAASDRAAARLFVGWLHCCLSPKLQVTIAGAPAGTTAMSRVRLAGGSGPGLTLRIEGGGCLHAEVDGAGGARIVPLGDGTLATRFADEIGVRTRDTAFERALVAAMEMGA
jgi:glucose-6-phosphate dehydrogenase assembly protein OpcA